jgi:hypothetical protein
MGRIDDSARSRARIWIALAGALLMGVLAIGFLQAGANANAPAGASGYGGGGSQGVGNGHAPCRKGTGYQAAPCPSNVSHVSTKPEKPTAGKGFKVRFKSKSGGAYAVSVKRHGKQTSLESGATGSGKTTTKKVGKDLKAGKYKLAVAVNSGRGHADVARVGLNIKK